MMRTLLGASSALILAACGGGDGNEVDKLVEQHKIMLKNACAAQNMTESQCDCAATVLSERLEPALFISAAKSMTNGEGPRDWLATVPEDQKSTAQSALDLVQECT